MELTNYFIDVLGTLSDCLTGQSQLYFFQYFSLFSFASLWKTLCKVKDLWGADLTPWTVSMKEGSEISHVTCCIIQMQIGSCNINCLNQFCKSCKFGGPGKRAAPIYICIPRTQMAQMTPIFEGQHQKKAFSNQNRGHLGSRIYIIIYNKYILYIYIHICVCITCVYILYSCMMSS